jgi:hypothetical protein
MFILFFDLIAMPIYVQLGWFRRANDGYAERAATAELKGRSRPAVGLWQAQNVRGSGCAAPSVRVRQ